MVDRNRATLSSGAAPPLARVEAPQPGAQLVHNGGRRGGDHVDELVRVVLEVEELGRGEVCERRRDASPSSQVLFFCA